MGELLGFPVVLCAAMPLNTLALVVFPSDEDLTLAGGDPMMWFKVRPCNLVIIRTFAEA